MNVNKLKGKIVERELTVGKLAEIIGADRSSLYKRLKNPDRITIGEAMRMKDALRMSDEDACQIFLSK